MRIVVVSMILSSLFLSFPQAGLGQVRSGSCQFSPSFGILWTDVGKEGYGLDARTPLIGANFSHNFTKRIAAEGSFHWSPTRNQDLLLPREIDLGLFDGGLVFHLTESRFVPYARGGAGFIQNFSEISDEGPSEVYITFGGGIKFLATERGGFRLDLRDIAFSPETGDGSSSTIHNLGATASAIFQFGGIPPKDTDGDGVFDKKDDCPDTPMGAWVDEKGCPQDADGDGVFNGIDKCADTPRGAKVDRSGCPSDSDGDGIYDGLDECPNTPKGARVDSKGCPKDSDGDGVFDGLDKCPDTPAASRVDKDGCVLTEKEFEILDTGMLRLHGVQFTTGSAELLPEAHPVLDEVGGILAKWRELKVEIGGHTDSQGSESFNQDLSGKRANAVREHLLSRFPAINPENLTAVGYGESKPIASNDTAEGREDNRRVEFTVLNQGALQQILEK